MRFFNSKEEVLDIQLTRYGRSLLSQGKFKPTYYAFYDNGVLYNEQFIQGSAVKNDLTAQIGAETRIQDETPYFRTQANFTGLDEFIFNDINDLDLVSDEVDMSRLAVYEKLTVLPSSLGTISLDSENSPAYKIRFIEGVIKDLEFDITGAVRTEDVPLPNTTQTTSQQLLNIPQLELDIEFKVSAERRGTEPKFEFDAALTPDTVYSDSAQVYVGPDQLIFVIEEENATFDYENFDIEVYEIKEGAGNLGEPILEPLSFVKPVQNVINNQLIDQKEAERLAGRPDGTPPELDPTYVEYFFNVNTDSEIDENIICRSIKNLKSKDLFNDIDINCPDLRTVIGNDIYGTDALSDDCPDY
tara:strand:- start:36 stop:1109 length:1074 start_codon:yes stop_codon:yes gene_type:complete